MVAPFTPPRSAEIVGRLPAGRLAQGPVVSIVDAGSDVFLLQNHEWFRVGPAGTIGPFGTRTRGAPGWIASAADFAVDDSFVYVLDRSNRAVVKFARNGKWISTRTLFPSAASFAFTPERIAVGSGYRVSISGFRGLTTNQPTRLLLSGREAFDSIAALPSGLFEPLIPVTDGPRIFVIESASYSTHEIVRDRLIKRFRREHYPQRPVPDSIRRRIRGYFAGIAVDRSRVDPPAYLPAVANAARLAHGNFAAAVITSIDSVLIEEVSRDGMPVRTFTRGSVALPVGLTATGFVSIREEVSATVVERRRF